MPRFIDPRFERMLWGIEHALQRAKGPALSEHRAHLHMVFRDFVRYFFIDHPPGSMERESLTLLRERIERATSKQELQNIIRDMRWYIFALSAVSRSYEMEERFHSLEEKIRKASQAATISPEPTAFEKEITLDSLEDKNVLFAIMPYSEEFDDIWVGGIKRAASGTGFFPVRIDMITKSADITDDIVSVIRQAKIVVVDVTKNNPNVMFELGYSLALRKTHIIISQSTEYLSFDIQNIRTVIYQNTWRGIEELHAELQKYIKGAHGEKGKKTK